MAAVIVGGLMVLLCHVRGVIYCTVCGIVRCLRDKKTTSMLIVSETATYKVLSFSFSSASAIAAVGFFFLGFLLWWGEQNSFVLYWV